MLGIISRWWKADTPRQHVLGFYEAMKSYHEANCKQWFYNLTMLRGNQWAMYDSFGENLRVPSAPTWRVRATFNKLLPLAIIQRHKLIPNNPTINTRPSNQLSDVDKENAETSRGLLKAIYANENFQDEIEEMASWMVPCTVAYLLTLWDGRAGKELVPGVGTGDVRFDAAGPFEIVPDYSVSRFKNVQRFVRIKVRSLQYFKTRYGKDVKAQKLDPNNVFELKAQALATNAKVDLGKVIENHAIEYNMYELPSHEHPEGFHHICTEDVDLIEPTNLDPYFKVDNGEKKYFLPWDQAQMIRLPGMLIGTNSVEQATAPQCYYNQGQSEILVNAKRLGRPKVLAPKDKIPAGAMMEDPAEIIVEYDGDIDGEIVPWKPPEMPQYFLDHIKRMPAEMQDAFGIHDASQGLLPRRATSGKAIGFLTEQDNERHLDPKADMDRAIAGAFSKALNIAANAYTEERIKDLMGDDGIIISRKIKGEELRDVDVTVTRDVALPKNASDRMDLAMQILDKKATKEQFDIVFAIMQAKDIEDLKAILQGNNQAEEVYARMENFDMAKGIDRPVGIGEDHTLHIKIHDMKISDPNTETESKMLLLAHKQIHMQAQGAESTMEQGGGIDPAQAAAVPDVTPAPGPIPEPGQI